MTTISDSPNHKNTRHHSRLYNRRGYTVCRLPTGTSIPGMGRDFLDREGVANGSFTRKVHCWFNQATCFESANCNLSYDGKVFIRSGALCRHSFSYLPSIRLLYTLYVLRAADATSLRQRFSLNDIGVRRRCGPDACHTVSAVTVSRFRESKRRSSSLNC